MLQEYVLKITLNPIGNSVFKNQLKIKHGFTELITAFYLVSLNSNSNIDK